MERKSKQSTFGVWIGKWGIVIGLFIVGIIVLAVAAYLKSTQQPDILVGVITGIGGSLVTAAIVDFVLMISTIKDYALLMVNNAYTSEFLQEKGKGHLQVLRKRVTDALLREHYSNFDEDFLRDLDGDLLTHVMADYYIEKYAVTVHFHFDDIRVYKTIIKTIKCVKLDDGVVDIRLISSRTMIDIPMETIFSVTECKVNKKDVPVQCKSEPTKGSIYNIRHYTDDKYSMTEDSIVLDNTTELILPISDKNSTIRVSRLCRYFELDYIYTGDKNVRLSGSAFCPDAKNKVYIELLHPKHLKITVDGYMLRGDGVALYFQEVV
jgi:hypothetical protein